MLKHFGGYGRLAQIAQPPRYCPRSLQVATFTPVLLIINTANMANLSSAWADQVENEEVRQKLCPEALCRHHFPTNRF